MKPDYNNPIDALAFLGDSISEFCKKASSEGWTTEILWTSPDLMESFPRRNIILLHARGTKDIFIREMDGKVIALGKEALYWKTKNNKNL